VVLSVARITWSSRALCTVRLSSVVIRRGRSRRPPHSGDGDVRAHQLVNLHVGGGQLESLAVADYRRHARARSSSTRIASVVPPRANREPSTWVRLPADTQHECGGHGHRVVEHLTAAVRFKSTSVRTARSRAPSRKIHPAKALSGSLSSNMSSGDRTGQPRRAPGRPTDRRSQQDGSTAVTTNRAACRRPSGPSEMTPCPPETRHLVRRPHRTVQPRRFHRNACRAGHAPSAQWPADSPRGQSVTTPDVRNQPQDR